MEPETSFLTLAEAESLGIEHDPPSRLACQYCGKEREPLGVKGPNGKVRWVTFAACGCAGEAKEEARHDKAEKAKREADAVKKLLRAGVPMRFIASEIRRPESLRFIESLGERTGRGLYLYGGVGAGKTSEASAIVTTVIRSGRKAVLTTTLSMLNEISKGYGDSEGKDTSHFIRATSWCSTTSARKTPTPGPPRPCSRSSTDAMSGCSQPSTPPSTRFRSWKSGCRAPAKGKARRRCCRG